MTLDTYSHVTPGLQEMAAKAFDKAFSENRKETLTTSTNKVSL
jgi:hypothetical protein